MKSRPVWLQLRSIVFGLALLLVALSGARAETPIPPSDADIDGITLTARRIAAASASCEAARCVKGDCASINGVQDSLMLLEAALNEMKPWIIEARKAALADLSQKMAEIIRKGNEQAYLEGWLAWQSFFQEFGRFALLITDFADFANKVKDLYTAPIDLAANPDGAAFYADIATDTMAQILNLVDAADSVQTQIDGLRDVPDGERGFGISNNIKALTTILQGANDAKSFIRDMAVAQDLLKEAKMITDAVQRAAKLKEASARFTGAGAAFGQLIGKIGLAVSEYYNAEMKDRIGELETVIAEEQKAAHNAWLNWRRLANRSEAVERALETVHGAAVAASFCSRSCTRDTWPTAPGPPDLRGADGRTHYGDALLHYNKRLAELSAGFGASAAGYSPTAVDPDAEDAPELCRRPTGDGTLTPGTVSSTPVPAPPEPSTTPAHTPKPPRDEDCGNINCDCDNLEFGILTGSYRDECRGAEEALKQQCAAVGYIDGTCHSTAQGPNAYPK